MIKFWFCINSIYQSSIQFQQSISLNFQLYWSFLKTLDQKVKLKYRFQSSCSLRQQSSRLWISVSADQKHTEVCLCYLFAEYLFSSGNTAIKFFLLEISFDVQHYLDTLKLYRLKNLTKQISAFMRDFRLHSGTEI